MRWLEEMARFQNHFRKMWTRGKMRSWQICITKTVYKHEFRSLSQRYQSKLRWTKTKTWNETSFERILVELISGFSLSEHNEYDKTIIKLKWALINMAIQHGPKHIRHLVIIMYIIFLWIFNMIWVGVLCLWLLCRID